MKVKLNKLVKEGKLVIIDLPDEFDYEYFYESMDSDTHDVIVLEELSLVICIPDMVETVTSLISDTVEAVGAE